MLKKKVKANSLDIVGRRRSWFCTRWSNFNATATYLPCASVRMGTEVWINKQINTIMKLCDVEIFQTTIGKRQVVILLQTKNELFVG